MAPLKAIKPPSVPPIIARIADIKTHFGVLLSYGFCFVVITRMTIPDKIVTRFNKNFSSSGSEI